MWFFPGRWEQGLIRFGDASPGGYDGSEGGRDAPAPARVLGEATGASALVVTVLPYGPLPIPYEILEAEEAERAKPLFEEAKQRLGDLEVGTRAFGGGS